MKNIFISHSGKDKKIVQVLVELIRKVSLGQICIWYSNDTDVEGGFAIGEDWFDSIINNLRKSQVVISLITSNSNNQPWILYESGYAEALESCILVPVGFKIEIEDISVPLQHKQIYGLSTEGEIHIFLSKLLALFGMVYDDDLFQEIVKKYYKRMQELWTQEVTATRREDNKLIKDEKSSHKEADGIKSYEIIVSYNIGCKEMNTYVGINEIATVKDVLDKIYNLISEVVDPYTYMKTWALLETKSHSALIMCDDILDWIPAKNIFKINSLWKIVYLNSPLIIK